MEASSKFERDGFVVVPSASLEPLVQLRTQLGAIVRDVFGGDEIDPAVALDQLHRIAPGGAELNEKRLALIARVGATIDCASLIYDAFEPHLRGFLGPDVLVQRTTNLVIQQPDDPNPSELHRDAPQNSPFELVVWVPMVDCYRTKSMYVLDRRKTERALAMLSERSADWDAFHEHCIGVSEGVDVPFGSALLFWSGLLHGSHVNREGETRVSLNLRYKSLFAPSGLKEPFEFFRVLKTSPLTRLGLELQRREAMG